MKWNRRTLIDFFGWIGALLLLIAYALLTAEILGANWLFHSLNAVGAAGVGWSAWVRRSYQAAFVEAAWAVVAVVAIGKQVIT